MKIYQWTGGFKSVAYNVSCLHFLLVLLLTQSSSLDHASKKLSLYWHRSRIRWCKKSTAIIWSHFVLDMFPIKLDVYNNLKLWLLSIDVLHASWCPGGWSLCLALPALAGWWSVVKMWPFKRHQKLLVNVGKHTPSLPLDGGIPQTPLCYYIYHNLSFAIQVFIMIVYDDCHGILSAKYCVLLKS